VIEIDEIARDRKKRSNFILAHTYIMRMSAMGIFTVVVVFWVVSEIVLSVRLRAGANTDRRDRMAPAIQLYAFWAGLAMILVGIGIRWMAIATPKYFTVDVAIASDHKVIQHGLYGIARHPSTPAA